MNPPPRSTIPSAQVTDFGIRDMFGDTPNYLDLEACIANFLGPTGYRLEFCLDTPSGQKFYFWLRRDAEGKNFSIEISGYKFEPQEEVGPAYSAEEFVALIAEEFPDSELITPEGVVQIRDGEIQE